MLTGGSEDNRHTTRRSIVSALPYGTEQSSGDHYGLRVSDELDNQTKKKGRKGHSKSRRGCYNCKRARIKVSHSFYV